jgi:hypothetical protein
LPRGPLKIAIFIQKNAVFFATLVRNSGPGLLQEKAFFIVSFDEKKLLAAQKSKHRESWAI